MSGLTLGQKVCLQILVAISLLCAAVFIPKQIELREHRHDVPRSIHK